MGLCGVCELHESHESHREPSETTEKVNYFRFLKIVLFKNSGFSNYLTLNIALFPCFLEMDFCAI